MLFNNIGLAVTFSPTGKALFAQALRLAKLFDAKLTLITIGNKENETDALLNELFSANEINRNNVKTIYESGEPARTIISICEKEKVDLLIAGALEKEKLIKYYVGSVARKLMRNSPCSLLICVNPKIPPKHFENICVSVNYENADDSSANIAYQLAKLEQAKKLNFIREYQVPGLSMTVTDSGSVSEIDELKNQWQKEEEEKLSLYISELNFQNFPITPVCLYGKQGWQISKYSESIDADLLIITAKKKKLKFVDRIFQHDLEYIFEELPCNLLILRGNE
jgi:nucleotide-binding universal stress UspA family protein